MHVHGKVRVSRSYRLAFGMAEDGKSSRVAAGKAGLEFMVVAEMAGTSPSAILSPQGQAEPWVGVSLAGEEARELSHVSLAERRVAGEVHQHGTNWLNCFPGSYFQ